MNCNFFDSTSQEFNIFLTNAKNVVSSKYDDLMNKIKESRDQVPDIIDEEQPQDGEQTTNVIDEEQPQDGEEQTSNVIDEEQATVNKLTTVSEVE